MSYGGGNRGNHAWSLGEEESRLFIKRALEAGINFFDTANRYSLGNSEEILGRAVKDFARRDEVVIATKVYGRMRRGPNGHGLSRKAIMMEIDASLRRLGTDYVDLYQIHRWDYETPIEETLEALHDIVKAGKARYLGASSMHAWQFARALGIAEKNGWIPLPLRARLMANHLLLVQLDSRISGAKRQLWTRVSSLVRAVGDARGMFFRRTRSPRVRRSSAVLLIDRQRPRLRRARYSDLARSRALLLVELDFHSRYGRCPNFARLNGVRLSEHRKPRSR